MTLTITPIVSMMPDLLTSGATRECMLLEFEHVLEFHKYQPSFDAGSMFIFTGACVKEWYRVYGKRRRWVRALDPTAVYALGVDAFETEV